MGRPSAALDVALTCNENTLARESEHARDVRAIATHMVAAANLNEIVLADLGRLENAGEAFAQIEFALRDAHLWTTLPYEICAHINAMPGLIHAARRHCACVDGELHNAGCKMRDLHRRHVQITARYRARNEALVAGRVSALEAA